MYFENNIKSIVQLQILYALSCDNIYKERQLASSMFVGVSIIMVRFTFVHVVFETVVIKRPRIYL